VTPTISVTPSITNTPTITPTITPTPTQSIPNITPSITPSPTQGVTSIITNLFEGNSSSVACVINNNRAADAYVRTATLGINVFVVGKQWYANSSLTTPYPAGYYADLGPYSDNYQQWVRIDANGVVAEVGSCVSVSTTPTVSVTATPTITPTISVTPTISTTPTISITPSITRTPSITPSITPSAASGPSGSIFTSPSTSTNVTTVAQSPFSGGGNAYSLNGSSSKMSLAADASWAVGTGDFTIEWFQYQTDSSPYPRIFQIGAYPSVSIGVSIESGTFYGWCSNANSFGTITSYKNSWQHFALVRRSSQLYVYRNGNQISTAKANTTNITNSSTTLYLGVENNGSAGTFFGGYLTNFRWVKGLAVYTGNFTTPTSALTLTASANPYGGTNTVAIPSGYTKLLLVP
jgi:hypothetical protein